MADVKQAVEEDLVFLYLAEVNAHERLTHEEESAVAKRVKQTKELLRGELLMHDFVLRGVTALLRRTMECGLRIDRIFDTAAKDRRRKERIGSLLPVRLRTLENLLRENREDYRCATDECGNAGQRRDAWRRVLGRRRKAARLIDELGVRMQYLLPHYEELCDLNKRIHDLQTQWRCRSTRNSPHRTHDLQEEIVRLTRVAQETPSTLRHRMHRTERSLRQFQASTQIMARANLRLVISVAKQYRNRGLSFLDLIQEGNLGLMKAVDRFDCDRGNRFSTYAVWWIRKSVSQAVNLHHREIPTPPSFREGLTRTPFPGGYFGVRHAATGVSRIQSDCHATRRPLSLDQPTCSRLCSSPAEFLVSNEPAPFETLLRRDLHRQLAAAFYSLDFRGRQIIAMRFGLEDSHTYTLREVGVIMALSHEQVRQIEAKSLDKLRLALRGTGM